MGEVRTTRHERKMGQTPHQREMHPIMVEAGFMYMRTSGDAKNIYRDKYGNRIQVASTPTNPSGAIESIKNQIRRYQKAEASDVATSSKTAPLIAEADAFLLKRQETRHGIQARNAALAKWVKRVMEKYGPMDQKLLTEAIEEMGFGITNVKQSRLAAGVVAYVIPGEGQGKGKGQFTTFIGLDHQVPPHATRLGSKKKQIEVAVERDGVVDLHPIGANNGAGPEPREDPRPHYDEALHGIEPPPPGPTEAVYEQIAREAIEQAAEPALVPEAPPAQQWPAEVPFAPEPQSQEVTAAAQMLLESLGLKTAHPRMGEGLDSLDEFLADLEWRVGKARESVATLKGLLG